MGGLGRVSKSKSGSSPNVAAKHSYEDVEGLTISIGVVFALLLPSAFLLQNMSFDEGAQAKNFLSLLCTQQEFRDYVVSIMEDPELGDKDKLSFPLGGGAMFDMKALLKDTSTWKWEGENAQALYECGEVKEIAATAHALYEHFDHWRIGSYALMHPGTALWTDYLNALSSFSMSIIIAGLVGSLLLYISLSLSAGREDDGGTALAAWNKVGFVTLGLNFVTLVSGVVVILFANDAYSESQDPYHLRAGRFGGISKIALLTLFAPLALLFGLGAAIALVMSTRAYRAAAAAAAAAAQDDGAPADGA